MTEKKDKFEEINFDSLIKNYNLESIFGKPEEQKKSIEIRKKKQLYALAINDPLAIDGIIKNKRVFEIIRPKKNRSLEEAIKDPCLERYLKFCHGQETIGYEKINYLEPIDFAKINYSQISKIPSTGKNLYGLGNLGGLGIDIGGVTIGAENIAEFVRPIVEYIRSMRPDCIVACDRGARMIGLAVKALYKELYGRLPTSDGTLRFRRISTSNTSTQTKQHLEPLVKEMLAVRNNPKVLVLDDWVVSGSTKQLVEDTLNELSNGKIDVHYGVLVGAGADVSGHGEKTSGFAGTVDWHDDVEKIGVSYHGVTPCVSMTRESRSYRRKMYASAIKYAEKVRCSVEQTQKPKLPSVPISFLDKIQAGQAVMAEVA